MRAVPRTDFRALLDNEQRGGAASRREADQLHLLVAAATAVDADLPHESMIDCRRRGAGKACRGHVRLLRESASDDIYWYCTVCDAEGVISNWRETDADLTVARVADRVVLSLEPRQYQALQGLVDLDKSARRAVMGAERVGKRTRLKASREELGCLAQAAKRGIKVSQGKRQQQLATLAARLQGVADGSLEPQAPGNGGGDAAFPSMTQTLLHFARPAIEALGKEPPLASFRNALQVSVTVWNAIVLKQWGRARDYLGEARNTLLTSAPKGLPLFDALVERKLREFAGDMRAVASFDVKPRADGSYEVRAKARLPGN